MVPKRDLVGDAVERATWPLRVWSDPGREQAIVRIAYTAVVIPPASARMEKRLIEDIFPDYATVRGVLAAGCSSSGVSSPSPFRSRVFKLETALTISIVWISPSRFASSVNTTLNAEA